MSGTASLAVPLSGPTLLQSPLFNKGSAFRAEERDAFGLTGLLPSHASTMEQQLERTYDDFLQKPTDMERLERRSRDDFPPQAHA